MVFTGTYEHTIDAKNRLAIPAEIRGQMAAEPAADAPSRRCYLYVTLGDGGVLCLYTEAGFEQRAAELDHSELDPEQLLAYERVFFSLAQRVEMDKQGRVRLPDQLLKKAALGLYVVLIGVKDHLEVHNRNAWEEQVERTLADEPQLLMNPRRAMRKKR